jgi:hypothetical protein
MRIRTYEFQAGLLVAVFGLVRRPKAYLISPLNAHFRAVAGARRRVFGGTGRFISKDRFRKRWKPTVNACPTYILSSVGTGTTLQLSIFRDYNEEKQDEN